MTRPGRTGGSATRYAAVQENMYRDVQCMVLVDEFMEDQDVSEAEACRRAAVELAKTFA
jgi:hypothetical protein